MTKKEFSRAYEIAKSDKEINAELHIFDGFGLPDYEPVYTTLEAVAKLIRYQTFRLDGSVDSEALHELVTIGRKKFMVLG